MREQDSSQHGLDSSAPPAPAPAWFRASRRAAPAPSDAPGPAPPRRRPDGKHGAAVVTEPPSSDPNVTQRLIHWVRSDEARGYYASVLLHVSVLLGLLSIALPHDREDIGGINAILSEDDGIAEEDLFGQDMVKVEIETPQTSRQSAPEMTSATDFIEPVAQGDGGVDVNLEFRMPAGGNAVTKGSFTAWTDPADPQPGQPYQIIIQIRLPERIRQYSISDLSGKVVGTDKYVQQIPVDPSKPYSTTTLRGSRVVQAKVSEPLRVFDQKVQLMIKIPGAQQLVRDTIHISSKVLDESQTLEIEF